MAVKMPIGLFVSQLREALNRKDGYIMGATGQNPKKWAANSWWFTQYDESSTQKKAALKWRENAERVWDCNGLAEGLYKDYSGIDINTKARFGYAEWCGEKGTGMIPPKKRISGAAVYWGKTASSITHIGYLDEPVDKNNPEGDWYIIEARGVTYGVVRTKLLSRKPNYWGYMTKYFDYENVATDIITAIVYKLGDRLLKKGTEGDDVKELQTHLKTLGYLSDKVDGEFGPKTEAAVKDFQEDCQLEVDGKYGAKSHVALLKLIDAKENATKEETTSKEEVKETITSTTLEVTGNSVNTRKGDSTSFEKITTVNKGAKLTPILNKAGEPIVSKNGWYAIEINNQIGWISGNYIK